MPMTTMSDPYRTQISELAECIAAGQEAIDLGYLAGASKAFFLAHLVDVLKRPLVVITPAPSEAEALVHDLAFFLASAQARPQIVLLPSEGYSPYEPASSASDLTAQRLLALRAMLQSGPQIVVTTPEAIMPYVLPRALLQHTGRDLTPSMTIERQELVECLLRCGYHQVDLVEEWGDFAVRGGIIDLFPAHLPRPVRLEFIGDEIESVREFDLASQRSSKALDQLRVVPLREFIADLPSWSTLEQRGSAAQLDLARLRDIFECLERFVFPPGVERLLPLFCESLESFFDYLPPDAVLVLDEPAVIDAKFEEFASAVDEGYRQALVRNDLVAPPAARFLAQPLVTECLQACQCVMLHTLAEDLQDDQETAILTGHALGSFQGRWDALVQLIATRLQEDYTVVLTAASETQARHIQDLLREAELASEVLPSPPAFLTGIGSATSPTTNGTPPPTSSSRVLICIGSLSSGFVLPSAHLMCADAAEVWGTRRRRDHRRRPSARARLFNYRDLNPGDHIVHLDYGIGIYPVPRSSR